MGGTRGYGLGGKRKDGHLGGESWKGAGREQSLRRNMGPAEGGGFVEEGKLSQSGGGQEGGGREGEEVKAEVKAEKEKRHR